MTLYVAGGIKGTFPLSGLGFVAPLLLQTCAHLCASPPGAGK